MDRDKLLGEFLRARRAAITPEQAGLRYSGRRRTPGLRREEVAMLAGVSTDYYVRLEQGRERHPSGQVLHALARVLDLGPDATAHLYDLARPRPQRTEPTPHPERVSRHLLRMIDGWPCTAAIVCNRRLDVLAANPLATVLYEGLEHAGNLVRLTFLNPGASEFYLDWEEVARARTAHLRALAGADPVDLLLADLIDEVSAGSADFRELWARHDVSGFTRDAKHMRHHDAGDLALTCELFNVMSVPGQQLITLQAAHGSPSERAMAALNTRARLARSPSP
jgi:transcriptional regulator with XRE-family HTH domain